MTRNTMKRAMHNGGYTGTLRIPQLHLKESAAFFNYFSAENLVTAFVPSDTACFASSPGRASLTALWTSREERVLRPDFLASFPASSHILSKTSLMNEFMTSMPEREMPLSCAIKQTFFFREFEFLE